MRMLKKFAIIALLAIAATGQAAAEGIVSAVTSSPIFANGILRDVRSGLNIHLQREDAPGLDFMDPKVIGYGIPPGGRMEVELVSGFERDPAIPLNQAGILPVVGTPQQGLPGRVSGYEVNEGDNPNTYVLTATRPEGMPAEKLVSPAPGVAADPIPQRGIKIIHVGRTMAFISRGREGVVAVRIRDKDGRVIASGTGKVDFLQAPRPQIFPTNIPDNQRNHNWQRAKPGQILGASEGTVGLPFLLFDRNEGLGNQGLDRVGVMSSVQLARAGFVMPASLQRFNGGLILQDTNEDGELDPRLDRIIGGVTNKAPAGAKGHQSATALVNGKPFLSRPTSFFNARAGKNLGGSVMLLVHVAGDTPGIYRSTFSLLKELGNLQSGDGSSWTYTIVVE